MAVDVSGVAPPTAGLLRTSPLSNCGLREQGVNEKAAFSVHLQTSSLAVLSDIRLSNSSYLGGRDQEDHGLRPGQKVLETPTATNGRVL
jgi:hypothetical protein